MKKNQALLHTSPIQEDKSMAIKMEALRIKKEEKKKKRKEALRIIING